VAVAAHIRAAGASDIPAVLALWNGARSPHASTLDSPDALARLLASGPGALLVAEDGPGGAIVGALVAAWDGWRGNMYRLAVAASRRRRGIGLALVRAGEAHLRAQGARRITALVAHEDADAVGLWAAAGYARDEAIVRFVRTLD
jgi:ribosomal protein S18 acetylase RimI-like enzyme